MKTSDEHVISLHYVNFSFNVIIVLLFSASLAMLAQPLNDYFVIVFVGSISCPLPKFIEGVTEETIMEAGKEYHLNPVDFYNVKGSFLHGYQTRFAIEKNGKTDCR